MALTVWANRTNRNGVDQLSPVLAVEPGAQSVYVELIRNAGDFANPSEILTFALYGSTDPALPPADGSFGHLAGGRFVGGSPDPKTGLYSVEVVLPQGATYIRAWYSVTGGPIRFGVQGEFRTGSITSLRQG